MRGRWPDSLSITLCDNVAEECCREMRWRQGIDGSRSPANGRREDWRPWIAVQRVAIGAGACSTKESRTKSSSVRQENGPSTDVVAAAPDTSTQGQQSRPSAWHTAATTRTPTRKTGFLLRRLPHSAGLKQRSVTRSRAGPMAEPAVRRIGSGGRLCIYYPGARRTRKTWQFGTSACRGRVRDCSTWVVGAVVSCFRQGRWAGTSPG